MENDKLEKAAKQDAIYTVIGDLYERGNYEMGFVAGAEWLMGQPLSERLTEEEKEKIKELNSLVESMFDMLPEGHVNQRRIVIAEDMLIRIFGKEMFE